MARKTSRKAYVRKNRRNATKKMVRTTARRAYTKRTNNAMTAFSGGKITGKLRRLVGKVPVVGTMASKFVAPLVVGAAAGAIHYYGVKAVQKFAPGVSTKIKPVQFTVAGSMVAAILMMGNKIPVLKKVPAKTRQQLAAASLVLGGGLDTYRWLSSTMGDLGEEVALYDYTGSVSTWAMNTRSTTTPVWASISVTAWRMMWCLFPKTLGTATRTSVTPWLPLTI